MAGAVGHKGYQPVAVTLGIAQKSVDGAYYHLDYVDVLPLVEAADIVSLGHLSAMEDEVDGTRVILDVEPVSHILAPAVHRQRASVADIVDEQRNQLFRKLVGTVIVGAVGDNDRHAVGVMIGTDEVVARRLGRGVRAVGIIGGRFQKEILAVGMMMACG